MLQILNPPKASSVAGRTSAACWVPGCGRRRLQLGGCYSGRPGGANNPRPPHPCAVIAGLREAGTRYIRAAGPVMRPPKPVPSPADQERRSGMGPPLPPPRPQNPFRSCLHQHQGFSLSTVSIDHILHGLRRACSLGQEGEDRVSAAGVYIVNKHPCSSLHPPQPKHLGSVARGARHDNWRNRH